jgi:acyl-CoA dehydrogenase
LPEQCAFAARVAAALDPVPAAPGVGPPDPAGTSRGVWRALGRAGVPAMLAGAGADPRERADLLRELLTALDARYPLGVVLSACVQVAGALPVLADGCVEGGAGGTARTVYSRTLGGENILALAATDAAGAGSDLMGLRTTARFDGDNVVVDGEKRWITNACSAEYALVLARHRPQRHFTSFLWVLVPTHVPGVSRTPATTTLFAGAGVGHLRFDGVVLDRGHVIGVPGRGLATFVSNVATERLASALWAGALCRRVLADTHRWLVERPLGDGTMWDNDAVRHRFARCLVEAARIDAMCEQRSADRTGGAALARSMLLKAAVADSLETVLSECSQLRGADAFADDGLALLRAEAGMFGIAGGASGAMLAGIADHADDLVGRRS